MTREEAMAYLRYYLEDGSEGWSYVTIPKDRMADIIEALDDCVDTDDAR